MTKTSIININKLAILLCIFCCLSLNDLVLNANGQQIPETAITSTLRGIGRKDEGETFVDNIKKVHNNIGEMVKAGESSFGSGTPTSLVGEITSAAMGAIEEVAQNDLIEKIASPEKIDLPIDLNNLSVDLDNISVDLSSLPVDLDNLPNWKNLPIELENLPVGLQNLPVDLKNPAAGLDNLPVDLTLPAGFDSLPIDLSNLYSPMSNMDEYKKFVEGLFGDNIIKNVTNQLPLDLSADYLAEKLAGAISTKVLHDMMANIQNKNASALLSHVNGGDELLGGLIDNISDPSSVIGTYKNELKTKLKNKIEGSFDDLLAEVPTSVELKLPVNHQQIIEELAGNEVLPRILSNLTSIYNSALLNEVLNTTSIDKDLLIQKLGELYQQNADATSRSSIITPSANMINLIREGEACGDLFKELVIFEEIFGQLVEEQLGDVSRIEELLKSASSNITSALDLSSIKNRTKHDYTKLFKQELLDGESSSLLKNLTNNKLIEKLKIKKAEIKLSKNNVTTFLDGGLGFLEMGIQDTKFTAENYLNDLLTSLGRIEEAKKVVADVSESAINKITNSTESGELFHELFLSPEVLFCQHIGKLVPVLATSWSGALEEKLYDLLEKIQHLKDKFITQTTTTTGSPVGSSTTTFKPVTVTNVRRLSSKSKSGKSRNSGNSKSGSSSSYSYSSSETPSSSSGSRRLGSSDSEETESGTYGSISSSSGSSSSSDQSVSQESF